jgi:hypothetical protein
MLSIVSVLALLLLGNLCDAGEVPVNWKSNGLDLVSENKLPRGARIKIRVAYLDEARTMKVNGQEFKIEKRDDNFRATVGDDGKVTISVLGLKAIGKQIDGSLYFQKSGTTGTGLIVTVED